MREFSVSSNVFKTPHDGVSITPGVLAQELALQPPAQIAAYLSTVSDDDLRAYLQHQDAAGYGAWLNLSQDARDQTAAVLEARLRSGHAPAAAPEPGLLDRVLQAIRYPGMVQNELVDWEKAVIAGAFQGAEQSIDAWRERTYAEARRDESSLLGKAIVGLVHGVGAVEGFVMQAGQRVGALASTIDAVRRFTDPLDIAAHPAEHWKQLSEIGGAVANVGSSLLQPANYKGMANAAWQGVTANLTQSYQPDWSRDDFAKVAGRVAFDAGTLAYTAARAALAFKSAQGVAPVAEAVAAQPPRPFTPVLIKGGGASPGYGAASTPGTGWAPGTSVPAASPLRSVASSRGFDGSAALKLSAPPQRAVLQLMPPVSVPAAVPGGASPWSAPFAPRTVSPLQGVGAGLAASSLVPADPRWAPGEAAAHPSSPETEPGHELTPRLPHDPNAPYDPNAPHDPNAAGDPNTPNVAVPVKRSGETPFLPAEHREEIEQPQPPATEQDEQAQRFLAPRLNNADIAATVPDVAEGGEVSEKESPDGSSGKSQPANDQGMLSMRDHAKPISGVYSLADLFPHLDHFKNGKIAKIYIESLQFCAKNGLPFPIEKNAEGYASWADGVHEYGHWIKPPWYLDSYLRTSGPELKIGDAVIEAGQVDGLDERVVIKDLMTYPAVQGVIPDIGMFRDMTPGEWETRVWSLQLLDVMGWPHPMDEGVFDTANSVAIPKVQDWVVWDPGRKNDPAILAKLKQFGIDVANGQFLPPDDGFRLPYPAPKFLEEVLSNFTAIHKRYGNEVPLSAEEKYHWRQRLIAAGYPSKHEQAGRRHGLLASVAAFDKNLRQPPEVISLASLIPANAENEWKKIYNELVKLAERIGVPIPLELKDRYKNPFRTLHDMGHWAHLPDWYNALWVYMFKPEMRRISITNGDQQVGGNSALLVTDVLAYKSGNDVIPSLGFLKDPLQSEIKVRAWMTAVCERMGWTDALLRSMANQSHETGRIYSLSANKGEDREVLASMSIDPQRGLFRPAEDGFRPPFMKPRDWKEVLANHDAILDRYGGQTKTSRRARDNERVLPVDDTSGKIHYTKEDRAYLEHYLKIRFPEGSLDR